MYLLFCSAVDECGAGVRAYPGGIIPDNQMTSSTNWSNQYLPHHGRLDLRNVTRSAWIPSGYNSKLIYC